MSPLERLWKDKMDIYRFESTIVNKTTISAKRLILPTGLKCHYSSGSLADTGEDGVPTLINSHKLFCGLRTAMAGDEVVVTQRNGNVIKLSVGEGFPYGGGMQFSVKRSDTA